MSTPLPSLPGVYWLDIFAPQPVAFLTGVPAFLGIRPQGQTDRLYEVYQPQVLHLWTQFLDHYDAPIENSYMDDVVQGFFENGGRDCVVCWLEDDSQEALEQGLAAVEAYDTVDLICAPDIANLTTAQTLQRLILEHCDATGDRFAILDGPEAGEAKLKTVARSLKNCPGSDYGALYGPWLKTLQNKPVPPCGHVAGIYAAIDRAAAPKAPANIALEGVVDVALSRPEQIRLAQIESLDDVPINNIRSLPGRGVRIWGARTLSSNPQWRYITVRRLAIMIHRWVNLNLADMAFEPNDFRLWLTIERELTVYLESLWQQGFLQGTTPAAAFRVRCDATTNSAEVRDQGQVITYLDFAPVVPNEFIQVRLIHGETGVALAPP